MSVIQKEIFIPNTDKKEKGNWQFVINGIQMLNVKAGIRHKLYRVIKAYWIVQNNPITK